MDVNEAWRRSRKRKCPCDSCFYCDMALTRHEHDHYPVPKRAGGTNIVAVCLICHDLKDRFLLMDRDLEASFTAFQELFEILPAAKRGTLEHTEQGDPASIVDLCASDWEKSWASLSPLARILYAKMRCMLEDSLRPRGERQI